MLSFVLVLISPLAAADVPSLAIGGLGLISLVSGSALIVFGTRSKLVASQQDQAISALEARLTAVEGENASLRTSNREKSALIGGLQSQITTLQGVVTSAAAIADLREEMSTYHDDIIGAIQAIPTAKKPGDPGITQIRG